MCGAIATQEATGTTVATIHELLDDIQLNRVFEREHLNDDRNCQSYETGMWTVKARNGENRFYLVKLDFDELDDIRDEMEERMWETKQFQEQMNRNYDCNVNEEDLDAEFEELEE